jgi:broad specificity phosphatase PhoE
LVSSQLCGRLPGIPLDAEGQRQSEAVARRLQAEQKLHAVYSSPLQRAAETAATIASAQNLTVTADDRLTEMEFGEWTGLTFQDLRHREDWQHYNRNRSLSSAPGGESLIEVQARAWKLLSEITARHDDETVAAVTHADVIRALVVLFLGMPLDQLLRLEIAPASITEVMLGADYPVVMGLNKVLT